MKSTTKWVKNHQSVVDNGRTHGVVIDLPEGKNGDNLGATALELCVMALSGCIGTIFTVVAKKMRVEYTDLEVELDAEKPDDASTVTAVKAEVRVKTDASEEKVGKILDRTMEMCPVGKLYEQANVPIDVKIILL